VYSIVHHGEVSRSLFFASAFVLPLQGFWNAIIYIVTSWAACKTFAAAIAVDIASAVDWVATKTGGKRRISVVEITDVKMKRMGAGAGAGGTAAGDLEAGQGQQQPQQEYQPPRQNSIGVWMMGGRKQGSSESTSMEDLTGEVRRDRVPPV
jgi:hypothetical protein